MESARLTPSSSNTPFHDKLTRASANGLPDELLEKIIDYAMTSDMPVNLAHFLPKEAKTIGYAMTAIPAFRDRSTSQFVEDFKKKTNKTGL